VRALNLLELAGTAPVHFMGIDGAGMCALAELLVRSGGKITGCDLKEGARMRRLESLGGGIHLGHHPRHVDDASALVITAAVPDDHPEVARALERGIPVLKRAAALGAVVNHGRVVAIAGTHGKTTTTAMATEVLAAGGMDPTGLVGGTVVAWKGNLRYGRGDLFVVEADEYDRSFHELEPYVAVVTNVEAEHLDVYGELAGVEEGFRDFLENVRSGGRVVVCADDTGASRLLAGLPWEGYTYGLSSGSQLRAVDVDSTAAGIHCRVVENGDDVGSLFLGVPGLHNLRNALGAAAAARYLGVEWGAIALGLAAYHGVERRFERLGQVAGVDVIDDYAHHPMEIRATLQAVRAIYPDRQVVAVFQPHLFSRTRDFHRDFGVSLTGADVVWVTDVFPAREPPIPGVTGELIVAAARDHGGPQVHYHPDLEGLPAALVPTLHHGDVVVTLGAGSVEVVGALVLDLLRQRGDGARDERSRREHA